MVRNANGEIDSSIYKWAAGVAISVVLLLLGGLMGDLRSRGELTGVVSTLAVHESIDGHPVMAERVARYEDKADEDIAEIKDRLEGIESKIDRILQQQR